MRDIPFVFFLAAVLCVTVGMMLGLWMGPSGNIQYVPVHVHLNLVGWATLGLFGVYYRLTPQAAQARLARVHAFLAIPGVVLMVGGLAGEIAGIASFAGPSIAALMAGSIMTVLSMLVFLFTVVRHGFGPAEASAGRKAPLAILTPAE